MQQFLLLSKVTICKFCVFITIHVEENENFLKKVTWTDDAKFTRLLFRKYPCYKRAVTEFLGQFFNGKMQYPLYYGIFYSLLNLVCNHFIHSIWGLKKTISALYIIYVCTVFEKL